MKTPNSPIMDIMAYKLPPMMRPVDAFIYRAKDPAPAICLISRNFTRKMQQPTPRIKAEMIVPKATRFPRSLLGQLKSEIRSTSPPMISPAIHQKSITKLTYPREKQRLPDSLAELDKFTVQNGKVKRLPTSKFEVETLEAEEETTGPYRGRLNSKPDLSSIAVLNKDNQELERKLKELTTSIQGFNGSAAALRSTQMQASRTQRDVPPQSRAPTTRSHTVVNLLTHNKQLLYNVASDREIPTKDPAWQRSIRQSAMRLRSEAWISEDPIAMRKTVTGGSFRRLYLSPGEERQDLVVAKYPFCRTCVTHSSPIQVHLGRP